MGNDAFRIELADGTALTGWVQRGDERETRAVLMYAVQREADGDDVWVRLYEAGVENLYPLSATEPHNGRILDEAGTTH